MDAFPQILQRYINASCYVEFCLGKDNTWTRHTSIVVKFDTVPIFTIDFGPTEEEFGTSRSVAVSKSKSVMACVALASGSSVYLNGFELSKTKMQVTLFLCSEKM